MNPWQVGPIAEEQAFITGPPILRGLGLARGSVGSFVWDSGVRDQDVAFCIREEQRNSAMVLALLAIQTCLRVYEEIKVDEARLLRLPFPSDLSPRQPALIPGVLFGEAVLRNLPRAYQICLTEANRRIAAFRRRNLASSSGSASMPPPADRRLLGVRAICFLEVEVWLCAQDAVEAFLNSIPTTPPHILAGGSGNNAAPTTPVEIVERLEDSFPPMQWNRPVYEGKGGDALWYYGGILWKKVLLSQGPRMFHLLLCLE